MKKHVLPRLNNEWILVYEPFYEIIRDNDPHVRIGNTLYDRTFRTFLPYFTEIMDHGKNCRPELKSSIIAFAEENQKQKKIQIQNFIKYSNVFKKEILKEDKDPFEIDNWIPKVERMLLNLIQDYATNGNFLPSNYKIDMKSISINSCELFIKTCAVFLQNKEYNLTPGLNDNNDLLTLLYVRNGRKLLMHDDKWTKMISDIGLASKYLHLLE